MAHIVAALSLHMTHIAAALIYFPGTRSLHIHIVAALSYSELTNDIHRSCSELLPSYRELIYYAHSSCSELLPSFSELKNETHVLLSGYSELKHLID